MDGLGHDARTGHLGQLFHDQRQILAVGVDEDMVGRQDARHAVVGLLKLRAPRSEEIDELFGEILAAARPQATPLAPGKYQAEVVVVVAHLG